MGIKNIVRNLVMMLIHPRPLVGLAYLPRFISHWVQFSKLDPKNSPRFVDIYPNLGDWVATTPFDPHYFYQAAWLARNLAANPPSKHFDIGSDVKLIGVLSAFVQTEFMDYRPLDTVLTGLTCTRGNILALSLLADSVASLSCLHVVEHIGLGRYGDPIDPDGSRKALAELERVIDVGGRLYLSVPVGRERVCFNAHRVFAPKSIVAILSKMKLISFSLVGDDGRFRPDCSMDEADGLDYGCGMFVMEKQFASDRA